MNRLHLFWSKVVLGAILLFLVSSSVVYAQVNYTLTGTLSLVSGSDPLGLNGQTVKAKATISQTMTPSSSSATSTTSSNTYSGVTVTLAGFSCDVPSNPPVTVALTDNVDAPDSIAISDCNLSGLATITAQATIPDGNMITAVPAAIPLTSVTGSITANLDGSKTVFDLTNATIQATGTAPPAVIPSPTSWTPSTTLGSTIPLTQPVTFTTNPVVPNDAVSFLTSVTTTDGGGWLSVMPVGTNPAGTNTSSSINISVNPSGLTGSSYTGSVILNFGSSYPPLTIPVTLTLTPPPILLTGPSGMTFNYTLGDTAAPASQTLSIGSTPASTTSVTASVTSGNSWLSVAAPTSANLPANFTVSVNTAGLSAGTLNGNIQITSAGATNSPLNIPVSYVVSGSTLTVPSTPLTFNYTAGGSTPSAQSVSISGTSGIAFTTSAGGASAWLSATPSGTVPESISVSINPAGLAGLSVGAHTGTVTVTSTGATGSPAGIPVTLNVIAPVLTASPSQLNFNYQLGSGTQPAAQPISVGDASGVNFTATPAGGSWLSVNPGTGSASGNLSVSVNTSGLAAGVYNGTVTVTATDATPQVVNVSLTVAAVTVNMTSLNYGFQIGGTVPTAQTVNIGGTAGLSFSATPSPAGTWLSVTPSAGTISGSSSVSVSVNTTGLAANTYTGTVTISAPGATSQIINVTLTVTSNATVSPSPSTLSFAYTLGSVTGPASQSIMVGGSSGLTFTATAATTSGGAWLSASPVAPGTITGTATVSINTAPLTMPGTYNGTVTIGATGATSQVVNVQLTVSTSVTPAPSSLNFTYTLGGQAPAAQTLSMTGSPGVSFTTAAATASGGAWLVATPLSPGTVPGSASVSINTAALTTAGTYNGTVTVGATGDSSPQMVNVTIVVSNNLTVSSSSLSFTYTVGGTAPAAQPVTIGGTSGIAFTAVAAVTTPAGGTWLAVTPGSGTVGASSSASVSVVTTGLAAGKYTGTVTIGANLATAQVVNVTFTVTAQPTVTVNTNTLSFNYQIGGTAPAAQTLTIGGSVTTFTATAATIPAGGTWLTATAANSGAVPGTASVSVTTTGLIAGTYNGTVTIAATGATSQTVSVTLVVTQPNLTVNTNTLNFTYQIGGTNPNPQTLTIGGTSGQTFTATAATASGGSWLSATPVSPGTTPGSATVAIVTTSLTTVGTYNGTVTIAANGAQSQMVNVTIVVTTAPMVPFPTSLSFTYTLGGTAPLPQQLNIDGGSGLAFTATVASGASWLSVTPGSGNLTILLSVSVTTTGLTSGKYTSSIIITAPGAPNSPLSVPVTLTVSGAASTITVSPSSLSFAATTGGATPPTQTANVTATSATSVTVATQGGSWLSASLSSGTTPAVVSVAVNQSSLTAGTYTGTVVVTAANSTGSSQNISVKLVVSAPATITASPTNLSFTYALGTTAPAAQSVNITSTAPITFTTSVANGSWLTLTSSTNSTPSTLTVGVNAVNLSAGTYTATISIISSNATNSPQAIFVALVVTNKPTLAASTASLTFTGQTGGTNPASQSVSLTGNLAVPFTIATSPSWLSVSSATSTTPSTLVVTVNTTGMAQGSYQGAITVTSSTATNSPITIPVTLNVTAALVTTAPTISTVVNAASYASNGFSPGAIVSIFGSLLGPQTAESFSVSSQGNLNNTLGGVTVTVSGIPAIPLYVQNGQINVILPFTLGIGGQAAVQVGYNNLTTSEFNIPLQPADVQIFTANASGTGPGSILNQDYSVNTATNPAAPGSIVQVFGTGAGQLTPSVTAGNVAGDTLSWVTLPYSATVNGEAATVQYAGSAPGLVYGVDQFNVQLPSDLTAGSATIIFTVGESTSQTSVTVFVK